MGGRAVRRGCTTTHFDTYVTHSGHNAIHYAHAKQCTQMCPRNTHNHIIHSGFSVIQSHDKETGLFLGRFSKKQKPCLHRDPGGNMLYWAASCSAEISNCAFSQSLSQTQAEARCRAWKEDYICTSKCECLRQRTVAKSQSEYKLGFNSEGVKLKGESLKLPC